MSVEELDTCNGTAVYVSGELLQNAIIGFSLYQQLFRSLCCQKIELNYM
jgi:hypothetical protein